VTGPENVSYAIFSDKSQPGVQDIFGYKENVFNYGILTRITMTSVNIVQGSETYTLTFPADETTTVTEKQAAVSPEIHRLHSPKRSANRNTYSTAEGSRSLWKILNRY